jgi:excisionase family DNA binding protein
MSDPALDIAGLAALLNVSKSTAYRLAETSEIPGFKIGSRWRFWEHQVRAAIENRDPWVRSNQARARRRASSRRAA